MAQRKDKKIGFNFFSRGHSKFDGKRISSEKSLSLSNVDKESEPVDDLQDGATQDHKKYTENDNRDLNTSSEEYFQQSASSMINEGPKGDKYSENTKQAKTPSSLKVDPKGIPSEKTLSSEHFDNESHPVDDSQDGATQNHNKNTENDSLDHNRSSEERLEQPASSMTNEGAKGDKYSENTKQTSIMDASNPKVDRKEIPSGQTLSPEIDDTETYPENNSQDGATQNHKKNTENDNRGLNTSSDKHFKQPASSMMDEGAKGDKYSENTKQAITTDASSPKVDPKGIPSGKTLSSEHFDNESHPVDDSQDSATQNQNKNTEKDNLDHNRSSEERIEQPASFMTNEGAKGDKYSENTKQVDRPGKPVVKRVSCNSVDIEWDAVTSFCNGDVYQVRYENTKSRKWNCQNFEINSGKIMGLEPGNSYSFKVRLVKIDGEEGKYGETNKEVKTQLKQDLPGKPYIKDVSSDSVDIEWGAVGSLSTCDVYEIRIENTKDKKWYCLNFETNSGKILNLEPSTPYTFKVRLVKRSGEEGTYGETSEHVMTKEEPRPGRPSAKHVFADRVDLMWERVDTFCKGDVYEVHVENIDTQVKIRHTFNQNSATIEDLQSHSKYDLKVRLVKQNGKLSKYSDTVRVKTSPTFASQLICKRIPVDTNQNGPRLYEVPLDVVQHAERTDICSKKYNIGPKHSDHIFEKTIMFLGATGSGKSTFIDVLANYVLSVGLKDPYRFTVTRKEDREKEKDKTISQTDWITTYTFNPQEGTRLQYRLNVIDTPGFSDTRGPTHDKKLVDRIRELFKAPGEEGVQTIDAVCFFFKAPDCRLTQAQTYIFNAIQSLFGKDIKENICLLITFADGSYPAVMDAVKSIKLPYGEKFEFNNLPWSSDPMESTVSMFWKMSFKSCSALLNHLETLETKSLQLTKKVLKKRQLLELTCQNLQTRINDTMHVMSSINKELKRFHENEEIMKKKEKYTYTVIQAKVIYVDLPPNERATNCLSCETTCHRYCSSFLQSFPRMCRAINSVTGKCTQCKCDSNLHKTTGYRYDTCPELVTKTYDQVKEQYDDAKKIYEEVKKDLKDMEDKQKVYIEEMKEMLNTMIKCMNRLNEIALRPGHISINEHIKKMIQAENTLQNPGFQDRINQWKQFLEEA